MEAENCETMTVEAIEWPFLKAQRDGGDPEVVSAASPDDPDRDPGASGSQHNNGGADTDHYEIVVSQTDDGHGSFGSSSSGNGSGGSNEHGSDGGRFETCLISNADLATLAANGDSKDAVHYATDSGIHYFDPDGTLAVAGDAVDPDEQQRLIKVYQTAMENNDSKLITVYQIKPEEDGGVVPVTATAMPTGSLDHGMHHQVDGKDVLVEIVSSQEEQLLRGATVSEDGTLTLPSSVSLHPSFSSVQPHHHHHHHHQSLMTAAATVSELRCTLCGFVSFAKDEIAEHCGTAHDLFLCQTCNLVFKKRQSLQAHARQKHGQTLPGGHQGRQGSTKGGKVAKKRTSLPTFVQAPSMVQHQQRGGIGRGQSKAALAQQLGTRNSIELMPDSIKDILAKNKAVLPVLTSGPSVAAAAAAAAAASTSGRGKTKKGRRITHPHDWARVGGLSAEQQQQLLMDTRLSDPQTRNQFNSEFAKKITSHGIGAEMFGMSQERLPSMRGTYRLDIKETVVENGETTTTTSSSSQQQDKGEKTGGQQQHENAEVFYSYDIVDTKIPAPEDGCNVICGLCNFSNPRIENVLFHCEIDHKQYYCQNKRCQNGFSSWDSLMRHMKTVHKREKQ